MDYINNKTRWVVKINDHKTKRVLIEYFPLKNKFVFSGQLKVGEIWYTFSIRKVKLGKDVIEVKMDGVTTTPLYNSITVNNIDIDDNILKVYAELEEKISIHQSFTDRMGEFKDAINEKHFSCRIADEGDAIDKEK